MKDEKEEFLIHPSSLILHPSKGESLMLSRRAFLQSSTLIALAPTVPGFLLQTARAARPGRDGRILVVVQLDGGNDGINTVVPFKDEGYAKHRKLLRLPAQGLIKINDHVGLHPSMTAAGKLLEGGRLAVVQGVGYPNPNRSHFESMAIWNTARFDPEERNGLGWIGRALDGRDRPDASKPDCVFVGGAQLPTALRGRRCVASALTRPEDFLIAPEVKAKPGADAAAKEDLAAFVRRATLDAYTTADRMAEVVRAKAGGAGYPATALADELRLAARLIKADIGTRVYYCRQSGYDTHSAQLGTHATLLGELAGAMQAFLDDLAAARLADRVVVLAFSEFGRTVKENGSAGTDHGTAGPVLLAGPAVKPGLVGSTPSLLELDAKHGDLKMSVDFRQVYATVLEDWLGLPAKAAVGGSFDRLPLFRS
jgi:uncharacterized protein (DUF1501 family)